MNSPGVLIIDGANVVGSRPDGWWRDRAGAARRLHDELSRHQWAYDTVILVIEGAARPGVPSTDDAPVAVVHAPHVGDDEIVEQARQALALGSPVTVATSDRALQNRLLAWGAQVIPASAVLRD